MACSQSCDRCQPSPRGEIWTQRLGPGFTVLQWHKQDRQQPLTGMAQTSACSVREHPPGRQQSPAVCHLLPPPSRLHKGNTEGARTHLTQKSSRDQVDPKRSCADLDLCSTPPKATSGKQNKQGPLHSRDPKRLGNRPKEVVPSFSVLW